MNKLFYPRPLQPGDTVALTAPSSPVPAVNLKAAIKSVKLLGLNPVVMPSCREHHGYMAGTDAQRASDLNEAFSRKDIAGIFCLRGGFGAMRLLPLLDFDMIRQNPKPLIGYSDITALHTSINKLCGFITFHGPMPNTDYSRLDDFTLDSLRSQLFRPQEICELRSGKRLPGGFDVRLVFGDVFSGCALGVDEPFALELTERALDGVGVDTGLGGKLSHGRQLFAGEIPSRNDAALERVHELGVDGQMVLKFPGHIVPPVLLYYVDNTVTQRYRFVKRLRKIFLNCAGGEAAGDMVYWNRTQEARLPDRRSI